MPYSLYSKQRWNDKPINLKCLRFWILTILYERQFMQLSFDIPPRYFAFSAYLFASPSQEIAGERNMTQKT